MKRCSCLESLEAESIRERLRVIERGQRLPPPGNPARATQSEFSGMAENR